MSRRGIFITIVSICYIFGNITCTLLNKNSWPFNSYNFFNFNIRNNNVPRLKILLVSDIGNKSLVDPLPFVSRPLGGGSYQQGTL